MGLILPLAVFLATRLVIPPNHISNEHTRYFCSKEVNTYMPKQNIPMENGLDTQSPWPTPLNINNMLPTQPREEANENFAFRHPQGKQCNTKVIFLPVPPKDIKFPTVEVLPNRQVCLNGRLLQKKCMPTDPVAFRFIMEGTVGSLIVSSSYYSAK